MNEMFLEDFRSNGRRIRTIPMSDKMVDEKFSEI